jgi:hypothetical protein
MNQQDNLLNDLSFIPQLTESSVDKLYAKIQL